MIDPKPTPAPRTSFKIPESVLVVIHTADMRVLLIERADQPGFWQSVTGSRDSLEETLLDAAIREVGEETGIRIGTTISRDDFCDWHVSNVYDIYPIWRARYAPGVTRNTEHVFSLQVDPEVTIQLAPREHVNYCWLPLQEAADRCFSPSNAEAILQLPRHVQGVA
jgi:dATP pyrophosphohydrolase